MEVGRKAFPLLFALSFMVILLFASPVKGEVAITTRVYGRVVDYATHRPIPGAQVVFWSIKRGSFVVSTDASGIYGVNISAGEPYRVYAYSDNPSTPGFDYVPALQLISVAEASLNVSFTLLPGASINVVGDINLFESPMQAVTFHVVDQYGLLNRSGSVVWYGGPFLINRILGLDRRTVIVPANVPIRVMTDIYFADGTELQPTGGRGSYLNLTRGDRLTIDIRNLALWSVADSINFSLESCSGVKALAIEAERMGFYVSYEGMRLSRAENLVAAAYSALAEGNWEPAYADLHEAYLIITDTEKALQSMYVNASQSMFFIIPLLGFTAVTIASIFLDGWHRRLAVSLALYGALFSPLYLFYPGYIAFQKMTYNPWAGTPYQSIPTIALIASSFLTAFYLIHGLPYLFKEKTSMERLRPISAVVAAFSVASRNLRRKKLRTLLTSIFMLISVFAFVALTSFSVEYGFAIQPKPGQAPSEGFLLRKSSSEPLVPFEPIEPAILQWLKERPETALTVPLMANDPQFPTKQYLLSNPLATTCTPSFNVSGVLGVFPSLEVKVTKMDSIIVKGRFLSDDDLNGILISEEAARSAELQVEGRQVEVNDTLLWFPDSFIVVGIFNSGKLGGLRDLDGEPLTPQVITSSPLGPPTLERVPSERVIIFHAETAQKIGGMVISRVDIQTHKAEEITDLARLAVLLWPGVEAFASVAGKINRLFIGPYIVATGFAEVIVPLALVVLNVGVMMLSAVYERKREVAIMSYVGLNPSHIAAVFTAEALVVGVVAGSLGYLLGLTSYRFMYILPFTPLMKQKVEATWGILALCLSIGAVILGSTVPALKASVIATPSLLRKWKIEKRPRTVGEPWLLRMPIQIRQEELRGFLSFMEGSLRAYAAYSYLWIDKLKVSGEGAATRLSFSYVFSDEQIATENELFLVKDLLPNRYTVTVSSKTRRGTITTRDEADVRQTANFIRQLILQYSTQKRET